MCFLCRAFFSEEQILTLHTKDNTIQAPHRVQSCTTILPKTTFWPVQQKPHAHIKIESIQQTSNCLLKITNAALVRWLVIIKIKFITRRPFSSSSACYLFFLGYVIPSVRHNKPNSWCLSIEWTPKYVLITTERSHLINCYKHASTLKQTHASTRRKWHHRQPIKSTYWERKYTHHKSLI